MSKEMIISVNGRERKIAILDNGRVSEFYIERGDEENAGIVGNIYKGRVQRVLPGMQSAFVNIGLERDAFLYVSDFFDEEEEIERIVMEKGKKSSPEEVAREAKEQIEKSRVEREKQMEAAQEIAEPLTDDDSEDESEEELAEQEIQSAPEPEIQPAPEVKKSRRNRRGRGRRDESGDDEKTTEARETKPEIESDDREQTDQTEKAKEIEPAKIESSESVSMELEAPVLDFGDSSFERIVDSDNEETEGDLFKDAYMQEAIVDQVRAIEFDMESTDEAEVGSLIGAVGDQPNGFERIADEDEEPAEKPAKGSRRGKKKENKKAETEASSQTESEPEKPAKKSSNRGTSNKSKKETAKSAETIEESIGEIAETTAEDDKTPKKQSRGKSKRGSAKSKKTIDDGENSANAEASVKESAPTDEMAVRRGGRGRGGRRGGKSPEDENGEPENDDNDVPDNKPRSNAPREDSRRDDSRRDDSRRDDSRRDDSRRGSSQRGDSRRGSQPTITDLLREGQEVLVQIAKEPIAKKGARITSHIALPGRHIVYMPTIEHLGVSRKIESANERARLRKLIQKIRDEEEIPSGGFIVRTAGVGVDEEALRDDARYLVRTWQDIKKDAEKVRSPAVVHQDLDLIQRLLRDQLSGDFAAIRIDSEDEYQRIVEFINRIQPRMVNRVKLYTRDEPILEAFGVQEEVDKALKPRVWLKSGGYLVINQTEALVAIDVNTGKFVGKGNARLEETITKTNMEAVEEIARQIRLRDLGGIIVLDLIDMEDRRNRHKVMQILQDSLASDKSPTKVLSYNDFGLIIMTRKRVKQSLERTLCTPCNYCEGAGWIKSPQTVCYEILDEARHLAKSVDDVKQTTLRVHPEVAEALRNGENLVLEEIEAYLGSVDVTGDKSVHQEQFDFAFV